VPAKPSSPIPQGLAPLRDADPLRPAESPHLLAYLATIPDPRRPAGCRHPLACILGLAAAAVLAGARSMAAIAEWAADAPPMVRAALGARRDALTGQRTVPAESTIRRTLGRLDDQALAVAVGAWLADRDRRERRQRRRRAVAVDGKTLRGARRPPDGRQVHLLAAMDHTTRTVLAQREVDGAPGEVPGVRPLLAGLDLAGAVVTADALHTHADAAEFLVADKRAHYLFTVKANQPTLLACCAGLPWHQVPVGDRTRDQAHGRVELRTLKAVTVNHLSFPHAAQVLQVTRKTRDLRANPRRWRTVVVYAITSLPFAQASPARLADLIRGHWTIENGLHWVRDVTFAEDASQLRTGPARKSWPACATSPSACSAAPGRSTSPPPYATTPATHVDRSPPSGSPLDETDITRERRSPASGTGRYRRLRDRITARGTHP
jgi:predicted transposase YbfD/YdcC